MSAEGVNNQFKYSIFNCCAAGPTTCCCAFIGCHGSVLSGAKRDFDSSNKCFNSCCVSNAAKRNSIREGYGIKGNCCDDIINSSCLPCCSAIQVAAEVEHRGPIRQQMD